MLVKLHAKWKKDLVNTRALFEEKTLTNFKFLWDRKSDYATERRRHWLRGGDIDIDIDILMHAVF